VGLVIFPIVMAISKSLEKDVADTKADPLQPIIDDPKATLTDFMEAYLRLGFSCIFAFNETDVKMEKCNGSLIFILGYTFSLIGMQLSLISVSSLLSLDHHSQKDKRSQNDFCSYGSHHHSRFYSWIHLRYHNCPPLLVRLCRLNSNVFWRLFL